MGRRRKEEPIVENNEPLVMDEDFFSKLVEDTEFVIANEGSLMTSRQKVRTPLYVLNCIYGGGIPLGIIMEIAGEPGSGKSTFSYQTMANYQNDFPDGVAVVYDIETSYDPTRAQNLGLNSKKLLRLPASSMEVAFSSMFKMLNKLIELQKSNPNISTFQIYDTISTGGTNKQQEATHNDGKVMNAGGMMEQPRILKQNLANLFPYMEGLPMYLGLLNQVATQFGMYTSSIGSGGGFGLKHNCHARIMFKKPKDLYNNGFKTGTYSMVNLEKSKLSAKFNDIPCIIDDTKGGKIDEIDSFIEYLTFEHVGIIKTGSWYNINETIDKLVETYPQLDKDEIWNLKRNYRRADLFNQIRESKDFLNLLQIRFIDFIDSIYPAQALINDEYKKELMKDCSYFDDVIITNDGTKVDVETGEVIDGSRIQESENIREDTDEIAIEELNKNNEEN